MFRLLDSGIMNGVLTFSTEDHVCNPRSSKEGGEVASGPPREFLQGGTRLLWSKSLSEFYIIIFLNKLEIHVVENTIKSK